MNLNDPAHGMNDTNSMANRLLEQARRESGWHTSRSDQNPHLTIKNALGQVTGHVYQDGSTKGVNTRCSSTGSSDSLAWLLKK